ncbi:aromatic ring-hydroxylating dioxygenase subunit alpha [Emcibacter sp.]|uniref:aromatic ring-hydroxylating oxygenase subunit alpha n=1 Tax=Emcibacter sp. TaxID=1979954 RepID=UPI002AA82E3C|nr:aromatic ring-hydroxylating dioxygenase subunit alpha [Emcibacter sp.]
MEAQIEQELFEGMEREYAREFPPEDFPALPKIPGGRYTNPEFLKLEMDNMWRKSWLYACHTDELPETGSYILWQKTGSPIVIVRGKDNRIRAFYNTCQHRGAPLVEDDDGQIRGFVCRYHGWSYDLEGKLFRLREKRDFPDLDMGCHSLREVSCDQFGNWVFVNEDPEAIPLKKALGPIATHFDDVDISKLRHIHSSSFDVKCNVKVLIDAFLETYHLKSIHTDTVDRFLDSRGTFIRLWEKGNSLMVTPHRREDWVDPGTIGMPALENVPRIHAEQNSSYHFFPNLVFPIAASGIPFIAFWPKENNSMVIEVHWFAPDGAQGHERWPARIANFEKILEEDTQFAPNIQKSLESPGFTGMNLSYQERRIYQWQEELDRRIGVENIPEHLRVRPMLSDFIVSE